jgi:hypothetical protein
LPEVFGQQEAALPGYPVDKNDFSLGIDLLDIKGEYFPFAWETISLS